MIGPDEARGPPGTRLPGHASRAPEGREGRREVGGPERLRSYIVLITFIKLCYVMFNTIILRTGARRVAAAAAAAAGFAVGQYWTSIRPK